MYESAILPENIDKVVAVTVDYSIAGIETCTSSRNQTKPASQRFENKNYSNSKGAKIAVAEACSSVKPYCPLLLLSDFVRHWICSPARHWSKRKWLNVEGLSKALLLEVRKHVGYQVAGRMLNSYVHHHWLNSSDGAPGHATTGYICDSCVHHQMYMHTCICYYTVLNTVA